MHCRGWNCMFVVWLREKNFDCGCFVARSFLPCSVHYFWLFLNSCWLQAWLAMDKKQECKAASPLPYGLYYCWDDCRFDLSAHGSWKYVSGCWLLVVFHLLLDGADFILEFAQWSICSSLLVMLGVGVNFMEGLSSRSKECFSIEAAIAKDKAKVVLRTTVLHWVSLFLWRICTSKLCALFLIDTIF